MFKDEEGTGADHHMTWQYITFHNIQVVYIEVLIVHNLLIHTLHVAELNLVWYKADRGCVSHIVNNILL